MPTDKDPNLQAELLRSRQDSISDGLFESGVAGRLIEGARSFGGAKVDLSGFEMWGKLFVPSYVTVADGEHTERELSLAAITPSPKANSNTVTYVGVGSVDEVGILHPYPGIDEADAAAVFAAANSIEGLREEGSLPGLQPNLLSIHNPSTAIMAPRAKSPGV